MMLTSIKTNIFEKLVVELTIDKTEGPNSPMSKSRALYGSLGCSSKWLTCIIYKFSKFVQAALIDPKLLRYASLFRGIPEGSICHMFQRSWIVLKSFRPIEFGLLLSPRAGVGKRYVRRATLEKNFAVKATPSLKV